LRDAEFIDDNGVALLRTRSGAEREGDHSSCGAITLLNQHARLPHQGSQLAALGQGA
jgi:hypothetical protein